MKVFLDIDGVMVPANSWQRPELMEDGFYRFNKRSVQALNNILAGRRPDIILTTTHRNRFRIYEWKNILKRRGIPFSSVRLLPKNTYAYSRKEELENYITKNNIIGDFVILDDDKSLNSLKPDLKNKLIQPSPSIGLV